MESIVKKAEEMTAEQGLDWIWSLIISFKVNFQTMSDSRKREAELEYYDWVRHLEPIQSALLELSAIKQRAEEMKTFLKSTKLMSDNLKKQMELPIEKAEQDIKSMELEVKVSLIDYIIKGETK